MESGKVAKLGQELYNLQPCNFLTLQFLHHHYSIIINPTFGQDLYNFKSSPQPKIDHSGKTVSGFEKNFAETFLSCPVFLKVCQSTSNSMLSKLRPHSSHPGIKSIREITLIANLKTDQLSFDLSNQRIMKSVPQSAFIKIKRSLSGKLRDSFMNPKEFFQRGFSDMIFRIGKLQN